MIKSISDLSLLEKDSIARGIPIVGSLKGKWLFDKISELKPKSVLELGTANGYSGCILGSSGAELVTIEKDAMIASEASLNFSKYGIKAKVIVGDGVIEIKKLSSKFDVVFIDFFKKGYISVLEDAIRLGKYIIADNISFDGCADFKKAVLSDPRLKTEIIEIKDGMSFSKVNK